MATMAGGTVVAAALAMERGWAVNLGGGMHHARHDDGEGWCAFADINLAVRRLRAASGGAVKRVMVVDLDVHQARAALSASLLVPVACEAVRARPPCLQPPAAATG